MRRRTKKGWRWWWWRRREEEDEEGRRGRREEEEAPSGIPISRFCSGSILSGRTPPKMATWRHFWSDPVVTPTMASRMPNLLGGKGASQQLPKRKGQRLALL